MIRNVTPKAALRIIKHDKDITVVDLREAEDFIFGSVEGSVNVSKVDFLADLVNIERSAPFMFICYSGRNSWSLCKFLNAIGYCNLYNVAGGFNAWLREGLPYVL